MKLEQAIVLAKEKVRESDQSVVVYENFNGDCGYVLASHWEDPTLMHECPSYFDESEEVLTIEPHELIPLGGDNPQ